MPNARAARGSTAWRGNGRWRVRRMTSSMSRSTYMLIAFAPPAARVPPKTTAAMSHRDGTPPAARTMVGTVVTSSSSMIRGFVSAMYARRVSDRPGTRVGSAVCRSSAARRRRVLSVSHTDRPHRAAPTARCGTTNSADRPDTTFRPPSAICTTIRTSITVASRRGSGASVVRRTASQDASTSPRTTRLMSRCARWMSLLGRRDLGQERSVHEREVGVRQAGVVPGNPRAQQHLGEDGDPGEGGEPRHGRPDVGGRHRARCRAFSDEDRAREHGEGHGQVRRHELRGETLQHDRRRRAGTGR